MKNKLIDERFRIKQKIGEGGQSIVYEGEDTVNQNRKIAIKIFREDFRPGRNNSARLNNEISALTQINSQFVIEIIASSNLIEDDSTQNPLYLVTELAKYGTLADHNYYKGEINLSLRLFRNICSGVQDIHNSGVIHRDLKPSNILLADTEKDVKVADFGICFIDLENDEKRATLIRDKVGPMHFAAPEQTSLPPTYEKPGDIFSLGRILYFMVTGEYEHTPGKDMVPISEILGFKKQHSIDGLVSSMCRFDPRNRLKSLEEVIERVDEVLGNNAQNSKKFILSKTQNRIMKFLGGPDDSEVSFDEILEYMSAFAGVSKESNRSSIEYALIGRMNPWPRFAENIESALVQLEEAELIRFRRGYYIAIEQKLNLTSD